MRTVEPARMMQAVVAISIKFLIQSSNLGFHGSKHRHGKLYQRASLFLTRLPITFQGL